MFDIAAGVVIGGAVLGLFRIGLHLITTEVAEDLGHGMLFLGGGVIAAVAVVWIAMAT